MLQWKIQPYVFSPHCAVMMYVQLVGHTAPQLHSICIRFAIWNLSFKSDIWQQIWSSSDFKIMGMFLLLLLPCMALGQTSLAGKEVKVTTVTNRPYIMPNNLSTGDRWPLKRVTISHLPAQIWRLSGWHDEGALNYARLHLYHPRQPRREIRPKWNGEMEWHDWRGSSSSFFFSFFVLVFSPCSSNFHPHFYHLPPIPMLIRWSVVQQTLPWQIWPLRQRGEIGQEKVFFSEGHFWEGAFKRVILRRFLLIGSLLLRWEGCFLEGNFLEGNFLEGAF